MTENLVPTPITDKNGKQTTVHRKVSSAIASPSRLSSIPPSSPAQEKVTGTPLPTVHPLSRGEVEEFVAGFSSGRIRRGGKQIDTAAVFKSLSGATQGLLWRVKAAGAIHDSDIESALDQYNSRVWNRWAGTPNGDKLADDNLRSYLLVTESLHKHYPELMKKVGYGIASDLSKVVEYREYRGERLLLPTTEMTTEEEVAQVAAVAAYTLVCLYCKSDFYDSEQLSLLDCADECGRYIEGLVIKNETIANYVRENPDPEGIVPLAEFMVYRNLGDSADDARFALAHFSLDAPALGDGHL